MQSALKCHLCNLSGCNRSGSLLKSSFFSNHAPDGKEEKYLKANLAIIDAKLRSTKENPKHLQAAENSDTLTGISNGDEEFDINNDGTENDKSNLDFDQCYDEIISSNKQRLSEKSSNSQQSDCDLTL